MHEQLHKKTGLAIMCATLLAAALLFWIFGLNGKSVDFSNTLLVLKFIITTACLILGLSLGLYFAAGKKVASQIGGSLGLLMVLAYVIGFLTHHPWQ
jgi:hypothetical protein